MALSESNAWVEDFLKQHGNKQPAQIRQSVRRDEEATQPAPTPAAPQATPAAPQAAPAPAAPAATPEIPKRTSLEGGLRLAQAIEDLLG
jgi:hypothetical protein